MLLENTSIGLDEAVLLDALHKKKPLSAEAIKLLKRDGLVEGRGKNIFISKYVALATNQEKEHSQAKGPGDAGVASSKEFGGQAKEI